MTSFAAACGLQMGRMQLQRKMGCCFIFCVGYNPFNQFSLFAVAGMGMGMGWVQSHV